jgi:glutaredoxin
MTNRYIIIGRKSCPFCISAADHCREKNTEFIFLDYAQRLDILEEYKQFHNHATVPIILANDVETGLTVKVGGYSELLEHL